MQHEPLFQTTPPAFRRARRIAEIGLSEIVRISEAVADRREAGDTVVALSTGEPDFETPSHVLQAADDAARAGDTKYPITAGTIARQTAIAESVEANGETRPTLQEIIVGTGAKQVLFNAFMATLDPGDEVVIAAPYWSSYVDIIKTAGGVPVIATSQSTGRQYPTAADMEAVIGPKTRWLLLNSPSNPSGSVYRPDEMRDIAEMLRHHPHVWLASDEIYRHITYVPFYSFRKLARDLLERMLIVDGVSKAYAMTGWRIGWGIGPAPLIRAMVAIQGQSTSGASSISQAAARAALTGPQTLVSDRCKIFKYRRDMVIERLNQIDVITCPTPDGAFYVFPSCKRTFGLKNRNGVTILNDSDFCNHLLEATSVAVVPGTAFGVSGHFRLSFAYGEDALIDGCIRIADACEELN